MDIREYGTTYDGRKATSFTLTGADGVVLEFRPGETFRPTTEYRFSTE